MLSAARVGRQEDLIRMDILAIIKAIDIDARATIAGVVVSRESGGYSVMSIDDLSANEAADLVVGLDVDLGKLATVATLRQGLERAARRS